MLLHALLRAAAAAAGDDGGEATLQRVWHTWDACMGVHARQRVRVTHGTHHRRGPRACTHLCMGRALLLPGVLVRLQAAGTPLPALNVPTLAMIKEQICAQITTRWDVRGAAEIWPGAREILCPEARIMLFNGRMPRSQRLHTISRATRLTADCCTPLAVRPCYAVHSPAQPATACTQGVRSAAAQRGPSAAVWCAPEGATASAPARLPPSRAHCPAACACCGGCPPP
jgi:hypothetical protein